MSEVLRNTFKINSKIWGAQFKYQLNEVGFDFSTTSLIKSAIKSTSSRSALTSWTVLRLSWKLKM
jgi:hypothetical protein